jgi:hypothetical protein
MLFVNIVTNIEKEALLSLLLSSCLYYNVTFLLFLAEYLMFMCCLPVLFHISNLIKYGIG